MAEILLDASRRVKLIHPLVTMKVGPQSEGAALTLRFCPRGPADGARLFWVASCSGNLWRDRVKKFLRRLHVHVCIAKRVGDNQGAD